MTDKTDRRVASLPATSGYINDHPAPAAWPRCKVCGASVEPGTACLSCGSLPPVTTPPTDEAREQIGRIMHESWSRTKRAQGCHYPAEGHPDLPGTAMLVCHKCHRDLIPWEQLPEPQKDINRHAFDAVLDSGLFVLASAASAPVQVGPADAEAWCKQEGHDFNIVTEHGNGKVTIHHDYNLDARCTLASCSVPNTSTLGPEEC